MLTARHSCSSGPTVHVRPALEQKKQASHLPVSGTLPCIYLKWADLGEMGNFKAEKAKKHGFDWQQGHWGGGGGCIGESPRAVAQSAV